MGVVEKGTKNSETEAPSYCCNQWGGLGLGSVPDCSILPFLFVYGPPP